MFAPTRCFPGNISRNLYSPKDISVTLWGIFDSLTKKERQCFNKPSGSLHDDY